MITHNQEPKLLISFDSTELLLGICPSKITKKSNKNKKNQKDALFEGDSEFLHTHTQKHVRYRIIIEN